jgi:hypothetical protein
MISERWWTSVSVEFLFVQQIVPSHQAPSYTLTTLGRLPWQPNRLSARLVTVRRIGALLVVLTVMGCAASRSVAENSQARHPPLKQSVASSTPSPNVHPPSFPPMGRAPGPRRATFL